MPVPPETSLPRLPSDPARDRLAALFPDAVSSPWWRRKRVVVTIVIVVVVLLSTALVTQAFGSSSPDYRTATVATRDVDALVTGVATFEPVSQATVAFPVSGTVSTVHVALGDSVVVGQNLASLDTAGLVEALHREQATLAQAELALERALSGEAVSGVGAVVLTASTPAGDDTQLTAAQQGVLGAQQRVDTALTAADSALAAATTVCAAAGVDTSGNLSTTTPTSSALSACQTATRNVLTAQVAVRSAQNALATASNTLDSLLVERAAAAADASSGEESTTGGAATGGSGTSGSAPTSDPNDATAPSPSSADLIAYQKAVDAAAAAVRAAEQAITQADIASPISGTVAGVELAVGESVTSGSTTQHVIVVGDGGYEAVTTIGVADVTHVEVGQQATLVPDGTAQTLRATVAAISVAPDATAATTSYRVVLGLSDADATPAAADALHNGSTGSVAIVTERATAALAVPTSALTTTGDRHTVTVLDDSTTRVVAVDVGVVGAEWTEIRGGVTAGADVVLANLDEPLPGSATASSSSNVELPAGFPSGGFPAGGPPGN